MTKISLAEFAPEDRRTRKRDEDASQVFEGTAVFVDIVGFTALTEALLQDHGRKLGAERLHGQLQDIFGETLGASRAEGGVAIAFAGDAVTLFFDADRLGGAEQAAARAAACAMAVADAPRQPVRVTLASGQFLRRVTGNADFGKLDLLTGAAAQRLAVLDTTPDRPVVLACPETAQRLEALGGKIKHFKGMGATIEVAPGPDPFDVQALPRMDAGEAALWVPKGLRGLAFSLDTTEDATALETLAQLRTVAAIFVQMRGFDLSDPKAAAKMDDLIARIQSEINAREGTVLALNTDAKGNYLSAVFGAPVGHESDPLRAVLAGQAIAEFGRAEGADLGIGIARGSALSGVIAAPGRARYDLTGKPMSQAARFMEAAGRCQILVGNSMAGELAGRFRFADSALPLASVLEGVEASEDEGAPQVVAALAERQDELAVIANTLAKGTGAKVMIEAAPGIGKSALLAEAIARQSDLLWFLSAGEEISQDLPYHAWRRIARQLLGHLGGDLNDESRAVVEWLAWQRDNLPDSLTKVVGPERGAQITGHVARALSSIGVVPVLAFDDAHWMDTTSVALLLGVVNAGTPVALVLARRPEPPSTMEAAMLFGAPDMTLVALEPLSDDGVVGLARVELAAATLSQELEQLVIGKSGGSPLFAQQIGRALKDQGLVSYEDGHCSVAAGSLDGADFLETVEAAILARLDQLDERTKRVALAASLHGRRFTRQMVEIALGLELAPDDIAEEIQTLAEAGYIAEDGAQTYAFGHALVRDAIGESMTFALRRRINGRLSQWWATQSGPEVIQRRARHLVASLAPDETDWGVLTRAVEALDAAARQAAGETANLEASQFQEQAIGLAERLPDSKDTRRRRLHLLASRAYSLALFRGYGDPTVEEAYAAALAFSDGVDHEEDLVFTLYGLFSFYASRGDYRDSARILRRITRLGLKSDDAKMPSFLHHTAAIQSTLRGRALRGARLADQSITEADALGDGMFFSHSGAGDWRIYSGSWQALGQAMQGKWHAAMAAHEQAVHLGETDHFARAFVNGFAPLPVLAGAPKAGLAFAEALVADADSRGFALFSIIGRIYLGWAAARLGFNDERVGAFLGGQLQISQAMKLDSFNPYFLTLAAEAHLALGDASAARQSVSEALAAIEKCGASAFYPEVKRAEAQVLAAEGAGPEEVLAKLDTARNWAASRGLHHFAYLAAHQAQTLVPGGATAQLGSKAAHTLRNASEPVTLDGPLGLVWETEKAVGTA